MDWRAEIRAAIRDTVREMMIDGAVLATVKSVDKDANSIVATGLKEEVDYFDVRLRAVLDDGTGQGIIAYPMPGSQVSIVVLEGLDTMAFVAQLSDIESYKVSVSSGVSIELTNTGKLLLNGDTLGGLVQVNDLVKRLNTLEKRMLTHQHLVGKVPTLPDPASNPPITPTQASDLANPNVTHG